MFFIEKSDKPMFWEKIFNIVKVKDNKIIVPIKNNSNENKKEITESRKQIEKRMEKIAVKTLKLIKKNSNSKKIVISKELQKEEIFINHLNTYGLEIQDGTWLFEVLLPDIIEYLVKKNDIEKTGISVLINDLNEIEYENIRMLAQKYKTVNIVTNHIEKFKKLKKNLEDEEGIIITTTNNKKKSLIKSTIIINVDFPQELFEKYSIIEDCIIINIKQDIKIKEKRFEGLNINNYEISFKNCEFIKENYSNSFYFKDIYEGEFYRRQTVSDIRNKIKKDKVEIKCLYLNNGKVVTR